MEAEMKTILLVALALAAYALLGCLAGKLLKIVSARYPRWYATHLADNPDGCDPRETTNK
jgi:hypothetical protein